MLDWIPNRLPSMGQAPGSAISGALAPFLVVKVILPAVLEGRPSVLNVEPSSEQLALKPNSLASVYLCSLFYSLFTTFRLACLKGSLGGSSDPSEDEDRVAKSS